MEIRKTILVGIDFTDSDETVIAFASLFHQIFRAENIHFIHVLGEESSEEGYSTANNLLKKKVTALVSSQLQSICTLDVVKGNPEDVLLRKSKETAVDLIVLGRKHHKRNRLLTQALVNGAQCNLFLIPDGTRPKINKILVPVDFSEQSREGLSVAIDLAGELNATIDCLHVYTVPSGYHTSGKDYSEYAEIMKKNAIKEAASFEKKLATSTQLNFQYVLDDDNEPADKFYEYAKQNKADLVCAGSRGMSSFASVFFDSTAEKMLEFSRNTPLLIIKDKEKKRSLLDAIREQ